MAGGQTGPMRRFGDGLGVDPDVLRAADVATAQALDAIDGARPDLVCVFAADDDPDALGEISQRVLERTGARALIGCSASGVVAGAGGVEGRAAVSVWAALLPGVRLRTFHLEVMKADDGLAVVGMPVKADDDAVAVLLADPYSFPVDSFVERANEAVGLPLVGGMAAGPRGPGSTRLYVDGRTVDRGAVGLLVGGDVKVRTVVSQGCRPIGPSMIITRAEENVLLELAGAPALTRLEEILNELEGEDRVLAANGLHIGLAMDEYAEEHERGDFLIRGVLGGDRERAGVVVGDRMEIGRTIRFHVRDAAGAGDDLGGMLRRLRERGTTVEGALLFTCNGRGMHMFGDSDHDVRMVRDVLAPAGVAGFFANGEIGPVGGRSHLHGFTASMLAFCAE